MYLKLGICLVRRDHQLTCIKECNKWSIIHEWTFNMFHPCNVDMTWEIQLQWVYKTLGRA